MLVAIETKYTLASYCLPRSTYAWEEEIDKDKTWFEWKDTCLTVNKSRENRRRSAGDTRSQNVGTANAATTTTNNQQVTIQEPHIIPENKLELQDSYFNKMSDAVANAPTSGSLYGTDIAIMSKILETPTLTNANMVREVDSLCSDLGNSSSQRANQNPEGRFSKTGYCLSIGYKVSKTHTSEYCTKGGNVHKEKATRCNPMGGSEWQKGWGT